VKDLSRWGRNYIEVGDFLEQKFPAWGVRFISINDCYDSATHSGATGGIDIAFRNLIYDLYSQDLSEKCRSGKDSAAKSGKVITTYPLYGYDKDKNDRHKLVFDPDDSLIVKRIFDLAEQGIHVAEIVRILNAGNVPTKQMSKHRKGFVKQWGRGDCWGESAVKRILRNECYTGKWIYGKTRTVQIGTTKTKAMPRSEWIIVPGAIPALITEEQFKIVQEQLDAAAKVIRNKHTKSAAGRTIFLRVVKCADCGRIMNFWPRKNRLGVFYCDMSNRSDKYDCKSGRVEESVLYDAVLSTIQVHAALAATEKTRLKAMSTDSRADADATRGKIRALQVSIEKAKVSKMSFWEQFHGGVVTRDIYQKESKKLTARIADDENAIAALEADIQKLEMESGRENLFVERYGKLVNIQSLTPELINELVKEIRVYTPDRVEIMLNYADEFEKLQNGGALV
jgi:hypothetical protein